MYRGRLGGSPLRPSPSTLFTQSHSPFSAEYSETEYIPQQLSRCIHHSPITHIVPIFDMDTKSAPTASESRASAFCRLSPAHVRFLGLLSALSACGPGLAPVPMLLSVYLYICTTAGERPARHASRRRASVDTLCLAHKGLQVARVPRSASRHTVSPFRQSETQCVHARARGSPIDLRSPPKGPPLPLPHSPTRI